MSDLWCPFAVRRPGPSWKAGYSFVGESGPKRGEVDHSAEGYWAGLYSVLDGPALSSWHFTIGYDRIEQHYPLRTHCWHAGDVDDDGAVAANIDLVGKEFLGMAGEDLSPFQIDGSIRVTRWCAEQEGLDTFTRYPNQDGWTLAEHRQVSDTWTACPSDRIPWTRIIADLQEEEDMAAIDELRAELKAQQDFQNKLIVGAYDAINFLSAIAVSHEKRIKELETHSHDKHGAGPLFGYPVQ